MTISASEDIGRVTTGKWRAVLAATSRGVSERGPGPRLRSPLRSHGARRWPPGVRPSACFGGGERAGTARGRPARAPAGGRRMPIQPHGTSLPVLSAPDAAPPLVSPSVGGRSEKSGISRPESGSGTAEIVVGGVSSSSSTSSAVAEAPGSARARCRPRHSGRRARSSVRRRPSRCRRTRPRARRGRCGR